MLYALGLGECVWTRSRVIEWSMDRYREGCSSGCTGGDLQQAGRATSGEMLLSAMRRDSTESYSRIERWEFERDCA